jgi:hypothetical protein
MTTTSRVTLIALPRSEQVDALVGDIANSAARAAKADPGDRSDVVRYERLCSSLEALAWHAVQTGARTLDLGRAPDEPGLPVAAADVSDPLGPPLPERLPTDAADAARAWVAEGAVVVVLSLPFHPGGTAAVHPVAAVPGVADPWRAPDGQEGARAVEARFRAQIDAVVTGGSGTTRATVDPSGVHNRVLAKVLHEYVRGLPSTRVDAAIAYRDGSAASHPFPLRCLPLVQTPPEHADIELHLALLSIRHPEMDPVIDGAWLRNAEVSRPRPAALTDDFVYGTSLDQLASLTDHGRRIAHLHIYQTGLDTAVVGFYRAVTTHLLAHPGTLAVTPMFAAVPRPGQDAFTPHFRPGLPWCTEGRS